MKRISLIIKLMMLACVCVAVVAAPPSSLAYLASSSNTVQNSFNVVYQPADDLKVPVLIQKTMVNLSGEEVGLDGFVFQLLKLETNEITAAVSDENGFSEMELTFTEAEAGKKYHYWLYEYNTERENIDYDKTVHEITIELDINENNELCAELSVNGKAAQEIAVSFENRYFIPITPPDTGDEARPIVWAGMLMASVMGMIVLKKKRYA